MPHMAATSAVSHSRRSLIGTSAFLWPSPLRFFSPLNSDSFLIVGKLRFHGVDHVLNTMQVLKWQQPHDGPEIGLAEVIIAASCTDRATAGPQGAGDEVHCRIAQEIAGQAGR